MLGKDFWLGGLSVTDLHPAVKALVKSGMVAQAFQQKDGDGKCISLQLFFRDGTQMTSAVVPKVGLDLSPYEGMLVTIDGQKIIDK